ncbi:MAG: type II toxin-antitoxin system VapC family toxin [Blastocatellia bacterium]|nr:type II toxin-antitoxin system VapC family toxin [Blastocatellia bacterium]HMW03331.1 type II toxin-antitoxin system VapC family toxin [Acidobacteriota bacterium]
MKFVIDTHTFLWLTSGDPQLSQTALDLLQDAESEIWLSEVSLWEIAIKMNIGKLTLSDAFEIFIAEQTAAYRIDILDVTVAHLSKLISLPLHHRDPFDRLLVAQALAENLPFVSIDAKLDAYGVNRIW